LEEELFSNHLELFGHRMLKKQRKQLNPFHLIKNRSLGLTLQGDIKVAAFYTFSHWAFNGINKLNESFSQIGMIGLF
jgi:hypothetical protein